MNLHKHESANSASAPQQEKFYLPRLCLALAFASLCIIAACGLTVGTQPYISENNVGPRSYTGQAPAQQQAPAQSRVWQHNPAHETTGIIQLARQQIGVPYRYGGYDPSRGFDCSGLIFWVYQQNGISLPRTAKAQASFGTPVNKNAMRAGDIVCFKVSGSIHTGIYSGNGNFIHSPKKGGRVREESMNVNYWQKRFSSARRVL